MDEKFEEASLDDNFHTFQELSGKFAKISLKEKTKLGNFPNLYDAFAKMSFSDWKKSTIPSGLPTKPMPKEIESETFEGRLENQEQSQTSAKIDESHIGISYKCELCKYETQQKLYLKNHMVQLHFHDGLDEQTTNWNPAFSGFVLTPSYIYSAALQVNPV